MNQWKKDRLIIEESILKSTKKKISIPELTTFLLEAESKLKEMGFTSIDWNYDNGFHDGFQYSEEKIVRVSGKRVASDAEQREYELKCKEKQVDSIKKHIKLYPSRIGRNLETLNTLEGNLAHFQSELAFNKGREKDIQDTIKGIDRIKSLISELKKEEPMYEALLGLDEDSMVSEFEKLCSTHNVLNYAYYY